ncbi:MAG: hypothetical protein Q8N23_28170 [Archangium sp.]|nr:hypothetical protein [Archangium sp.]MDP3156581.1 hypothetical protein [Archangium sp.]MDP3576318.1 hypothetical protein [Archangium sp.]
MVFALLVASAVLGAKPVFQDVLKKFPAATLPITIKDLEEHKVKLTAAEAGALGFLKDSSEALSGLRAWKEKGGKKQLWPVAAIRRTRSLVLLLQYDADTNRQTYLLTYDDQGALLGGLLFHVSNAGSENDVSTLDQAGVISRLITAKHQLQDDALPEVVVLAEQRAKLTSTGSLEVISRAWSRRSGRYIDRKTKEEFLVSDKRVFYRPDDAKPLQELQGDGNTMRLEGSEKPWQLTWNDRRSDISAQNPRGEVQVFTREW